MDASLLHDYAAAVHIWSFSVLPQHLEALLEALSAEDPTRLVVTRTPGKKRQLMQFFAETFHKAEALRQEHGGTVEKATDAWQRAAAPHPPIRIRDRFLLVEVGSTPPDAREIILPAGLAFGTGDHPTTASCLRLLCDVIGDAPEKSWRMLDAGTGTGVLAIAARKLGVRVVAGFDYDPLSIRTARENARLNGVRGISWSREDLQTFSATTTYDVVASNIFSELFIGTWSRLRPAVAPGGRLILSGILRFQAPEIRAALAGTRFTIQREIRLGKWMTFLARAEN